MEKNWLEHPLLRGIDLDSEAYINAQRRVLQRKKFLHRVYRDFYELMAEYLPPQAQRVVELGSGAGFLEEVIPHVTRTDVLFHTFTDLVMDGMQPPFEPGSLDVVVFLDVFHHIPDSRMFLQSSTQALREGGRIIMIEPGVSRWSKAVYGRLHREPLDWMAERWAFESSGPVSGANQALPWIVFQRDREVFEREFPHLKILEIRPMMPFRFLASGGLSSRLGLPVFLYQPVRWLEKLFDGNLDRWAMFALIVLEKVR